MRLGLYKADLLSNSVVANVYGKSQISERHRHRYELNNNYIETLEKHGLRITGKSIDGNLMEVIEIPAHPWFLACQFHPEFTSTPRGGHALFTGFVKAAIKQHELTHQAAQ